MIRVRHESQARLKLLLRRFTETGLLQAEQSLLISWRSDNPELSSKAYFLRTYTTTLDSVEAMLAVCRAIGVSCIGIVTDDATENVQFQTLFLNLILSSGGIVSEGGD